MNLLGRLFRKTNPFFFFDFDVVEVSGPKTVGHTRCLKVESDSLQWPFFARLEVIGTCHNLLSNQRQPTNSCWFNSKDSESKKRTFHPKYYVYMVSRQILIHFVSYFYELCPGLYKIRSDLLFLRNIKIWYPSLTL